MFSSDLEIWQAVKKLKGQTLSTISENRNNFIIDVEDSNNKNDRVIIQDRETYPIKEDIIVAYRLLISNGELKRIPDLDWLSGPEKKTSSIIFKIVSEISNDHSKVISLKGNRNHIIKLQS